MFCTALFLFACHNTQGSAGGERGHRREAERDTSLE
jgi:hypothetical protein